MQDRHEDAPFDDNKYHFPSNTLTPAKQPGIRVALERDELVTPGFHPRQNDEQKYAGIASAGLHYATPPYSPQGTAHVDELTSQGIQVVYTPGQQHELTRSQEYFASQEQLSSQSTRPSVNPSAGQSFQTLLPLSYSAENPMDLPELVTWNTESRHLNPQANTPPSSSWPKEHGTSAKKDVGVKRWMPWIIGGAISILVIIGAVLGGVLGTRSHSNNDEVPVPSNLPIDKTAPSIPTPTQAIKTGSKLAITGYRTGTDYSIRLFYQDRDDQIRFTDKETIGANWTKPTVLDTLPYQPMVGGAIAAGAYMIKDPVPKIEFFYEDKDGIVRGQNFNFEFENGKIPWKGETGSINKYPLQMAKDTRLSCYFPYIASQDENNRVRWTMLKGQNRNNLSAPWWVNDTDWNVEASQRAGIVALPIAQTFVNAGGIVYRSAEGMLSIKIRDELESSNEGVAWRKGALSKEIPANTSIGAFSIGRPYNNENQVNTYILYQEDDDTIQVVWQDDETGWKGPKTYEALAGAQKGTDIVCLTAGAYGLSGVKVSREQDMNRCFFLTIDTTVREVWYNGTDWINVGVVPMP